MNSKYTTIKKLSCFITAFVLVFLASFGLMFNNNIKPSFASTQTNGITSVSIKNSNFNSNTSYKQPFSPSNFTPTMDEENANLTAGVINLDKGDYAGKYNKNPMSEDEYVLLIDSADEDKNYHTANFGYTTDDYITLNQNSNYRFTVDVLTSNHNGIASIYLFNEDGSVFTKFDGISADKWDTYCLFVSTNELTSIKVKLGLYLQGSGTVLFDNISCNELSNNILNDNLESYENLNTVKYIYTNKRENTIIKQPIYTESLIQTSFELNKNSDEYTKKSVPTYNEDNHATDGTNTTAVKIQNFLKTYNQYSTKDDFITLKQNNIYKISVMAKTVNLSGTAKIKLTQTNLDKDTASKDASVNVSSSSSNNIYNGYSEYVFYVRTGCKGDVTYKLEFGVGDNENLSTGSLYVTQMEIATVGYETYNSATTGSSTAKIDFYSDYIVSDSDIMLNNGNFNGFKIPSSTQTFPAEATNWSVTEGSGTQYYGVVNTGEFDKLNTLNLTALANPGDPGMSISNNNNNILMMYNEGKDSLSIKSTSKSLSSKTYYKFSIDVQTQSNNNTPLKISLVSTKDDKEFTICSKDILTNSFEWKTVDFYLYTAYHNLDVSVKLELNSDSYAYAYVDNAMFNYEIQPDETSFKKVQEGNYTIKTDLTNILTYNEDESINIFGIYKNNAFLSEGSNGISGIVDITNANGLVETANLEKFTSLEASNKNAIIIRAYNDTKYTLTSNFAYKLTKNSYYKLTVSVYTQNLQAIDSETKDFGANLKLTGFEGGFTNVKSDNCWTTYTLLLNPTSDITTYLTLSVGDDDYLTTGDAFFANIVFDDSINSEDYNNTIENSTVKKLEISTQTDDTTADEDTEVNENKFNSSVLLYQISSLIFILAIVIAVVGVLLRKIKWKKHVKTSINYDRKDTVSKQYYDRIATTRIQEMLRELNKDLTELNNERIVFENNYKKDMTKLREMKIKRASSQEIAALEKDMKKNQKTTAQIGVKINSIESEIKFIQTDGYKQSLIRKLQTENKSNALNENNENIKEDNKSNKSK